MTQASRINLFKVAMSDHATAEVSKVLYSGFIGQGPKVEDFEDLLWEELGTETRPVTVNSCTSAIDLALELIGVGPYDEVISSPQSCFASQVGAIHKSARIRWADIDPITGLIDPVSVEKLITPRTKAIICVNWGGRICDFDKLKSFGVPVVEDAAHTWDVFVDKNISRGDYICYSFQAIKYLTTGDGGLLICPKDKEKDARTLRWFGLDRTKGESFRCAQDIERAGFKYHMNDIAAAIGICNIPEARNSVLVQCQNAKKLCESIKNKDIVIPEFDKNCSYWLMSIHIKNGRKAEFIEYLKERNIDASPVHYRNDLYTCVKDFREDDLPGVSSFHETQVCIPIGWWLTENELNKIITVVNAF